MMRSIFFILITIITPELMAQGVVFNSTYNFDGSSVGGCLAVKENGYFIQTNLLTDTTYRALIASIDLEGNVLDSIQVTQYDSFGISIGNYTRKVNSNLFATVGYFQDTSLNAFPLVYFFNSELEKQDIDTLGFSGSYIDAIGHNNQYFIAGQKQFNDGDRNFLLIAYDDELHKLRHKNYGHPSKREVAYSISQTPDGGYVLSGYRSNTNNDSNPYIIKTDSNGVLQWQKEIVLTEWNDNSTNNCIDEFGNIYLGGAKVKDKLNNGHEYKVSWLCKLSSDGSIIWEKAFNNTSSSSACVGLVQRRNGNLLMLVQSQRDSLNRFLARIYEVDTAGSLIKNIVVEYNPALNPNGFDYPRSIDTTSDNGFIIAGFATQLPTGQDLWVVKFDSNGCYDYSNNSCTVGIEEFSDISLQLSVWPNPAQDVLNIETDSPMESIKVYNQLGNETLFMDTERSRSDQRVNQQIDVSSFKPGLYFLVVKTEKGIETKKFIKSE